MPKENIKIFTDRLKAVAALITKDDFAAAFQALLKIIVKIEENQNKKIDKKLGEIKDGEDGYTPIKNKDYRDGKDGARGQKGDTGPAGESVVGSKGEDGKDGSPDMAEDVRNKLELLEGNERLDRKAIKGLDELEKSVKETTSRRVQTPAKAYRIYTKDASSQCDGVATAFSVGGSHFGIVGVFSTQFPLIFRPVIDFSETSTGILLSSAVSAPESGQTLVIQFLK